MAKQSNPRPTLQAWLQRLSREEMPILGETMRQVIAVTEDDETSVAQLATVILQDSSMTARVLRVANSVHYNPGGNRLSTVSSAIVTLGFDTIRSIALSLALVDTVLRAENRQRVLEEMARSFHAAVQAKGMAEHGGDGAPEEVFVAALLYRLGQITFWCFPDGFGEALEAQLDAGEEEGKAEQAVLGFRLRDLSAAMNHEWRLSELLHQAFRARNPERHGRLVHLVLAQELADRVRGGWHSKAVAETLGRVAEAVGLSPEKARTLLQEQAREAAETVAEYGASEAARLIPVPGAHDEYVSPDTTEAAGHQPDPELQMAILRELSGMITRRVDLNALLGTVLEGVYRGVGMDRAVFALVSSDRTRLQARYVLGDGHERLLECFRSPVSPTVQNPFAETLTVGEPRWISGDGAVAGTLTDCVGAGGFFLSPVAINGRPWGLFYADRHTSARALDEAAFDAFRHLCEQANIGVLLFSAAARRPPS